MIKGPEVEHLIFLPNHEHPSLISRERNSNGCMQGGADLLKEDVYRFQALAIPAYS